MDLNTSSLIWKNVAYVNTVYVLSGQGDPVMSTGFSRKVVPSKQVKIEELF